MRLLLVALSGLLFFQHTTPCCATTTTDTLSHGHVLTGAKRLVSKNGKFALGFFQTGSKSSNSTLNLYLGIWFNKVSKLTPVWSANGAKPIPGGLASQELIISGDGNLVVLAHHTIIWSTRANITAKNTVVVLLGNGNLVLRSSVNSSDIFWQSIDYPTDTLLAGAKFGRNKITGLNRLIVSRKNLIDQAPGLYSNGLGLDQTMRISWNSSVVYWSSGEWNGRFFDSIPEMSGHSLCNYTFVNNDQELYFSYSMLHENTIFQVLLDVSRQWKVRIWNAHEWVTFSRYPKYHCDVYAVCGAFTVCSNNENPLCNCMKGFSVRSPGDWELEDRTGGCIRNTPLNCYGGEKNRKDMTDKFYSMPSIRLPRNGIGILNATSAKACAQVCLGNCSCTAYSYGQGGCSIWHDALINVATDDNGEILYLCLAAKEVQSWKSNKHEMIVSVTVGIAIVTLGLIFLLVIWRNRKWSSHSIDYDEGVIGITAFRYADIKRATKNFSEKLGGGGFGSVFKGCLSDSVAIAVKMLDGACQGEKQFRAEVSSLGIIQHINLVKLIGFCCEGDRRLLVYEHMPNRSLDTHLFQSHDCAILHWNIRYQIALGVARGLAYLHHSCRNCIIHCDIKPQNILLDSSFIPKVADFGMAKFLGRDFSRAVTTMRGTIGYLAPEWISGTAITSKVDVYSYGMVLLEIVSGKRNSDKEFSNNDDHARYFPVQVANKLLNNDVGSLVDANLQGDMNLDLEEVERVCKVACWCIQDNEFDRPTMGEVVQFLEGMSQPDMPPMPGLLHAIAGGPPSM